jgi:hypothetical protein
VQPIGTRRMALDGGGQIERLPRRRGGGVLPDEPQLRGRGHFRHEFAPRRSSEGHRSTRPAAAGPDRQGYGSPWQSSCLEVDRRPTEKPPL